jgi:glutaredoxin 3
MPLIEIYTKAACPNCETAKRMLTEKKVDFVEYVIGENITRDAVLAKFPGVKAVPIVVVDGREVREVAQFRMLLEGV